MNEGIYYLRVNEQVEGPYSIGQIYDLWAARKINSQTPFARFEEMDKWQPLSELTLKISAPRSGSPKTPAEPSTLPQLPKQKSTSSARSEEYVPRITGNESRPPVRQPNAPSPFAPMTKVLFSLPFSIGFSLLTGILGAIYFLFFFSARSNEAATFQDYLATKQSGVWCGISMIVLSGLLAIAREVRTLQNQSSSDQKSDRKSLLS